MKPPIFFYINFHKERRYLFIDRRAGNPIPFLLKNRDGWIFHLFLLVFVIGTTFDEK